MTKRSAEPASYRLNWLAVLFAAHADYESLTSTKDGIVLKNDSGPTTLSYLSVGSGITAAVSLIKTDSDAVGLGAA